MKNDDIIGPEAAERLNRYVEETPIDEWNDLYIGLLSGLSGMKEFTDPETGKRRIKFVRRGNLRV